MTFYGPIAYSFNFHDRRTIRVTCTDDRRPSFVDVERPGEPDRRLEVPAGQTLELEVEPGLVDVAFGACIRGELLEP